MKNNRKYVRYTIKCSGYITDDTCLRYRFQMNNISACGISITTDREMETSPRLTISFDATGPHLPHAKQLRGRVVRVKAVSSGFTYGIYFNGLNVTETIEIDEYLRCRHGNSLEKPAEDAYPTVVYR